MNFVLPDSFELDPTDQPEPLGGVPSLFIRKITIPTKSRPRAMAAVQLQLPRLSPVPLEEVVYSIALCDGAEPPKWAVAVARRTDITRACQAAGSTRVEVCKRIEGDELVFTFSDPEAADARIAGLVKLLPALAALSFSVLLLLVAAHVRLTERIAAMERPGGVWERSENTYRLAQEQVVAVRSWNAAQGSPSAEALMCILQSLAKSGGASWRIAAVQGGQSAATVTLIGAHNEFSKEDLEVRTEGQDVAARTYVRAASGCGAGA